MNLKSRGIIRYIDRYKVVFFIRSLQVYCVLLEPKSKHFKFPKLVLHCYKVLGNVDILMSKYAKRMLTLKCCTMYINMYVYFVGYTKDGLFIE